MDAYNAYVQDQQAKAAQSYDDEEEEGEDGEAKEVPQKPVFDPTEHFEKFDEDNPPIVIPAEIPIEVDNDWPMTPEEEEELIVNFWAAKEGQ